MLWNLTLRDPRPGETSTWVTLLAPWLANPALVQSFMRPSVSGEHGARETRAGEVGKERKRSDTLFPAPSLWRLPEHLSVFVEKHQ